MILLTSLPSLELLRRYCLPYSLLYDTCPITQNMDSQHTVESDLVSEMELNELMSVMITDGINIEELAPELTPVIPPDENGGQYGPTGVLPSTEVVTGRCGFKLSIVKNPTKCSWLYSTELDQVFIDIDKVLMATFTIDYRLPGMYIRAMPVYVSSDYTSTAVLRCQLHQLNDDPHRQAHNEDDDCFCDSYNLAGHVLRVDAVERWYCYDKSSGRHSVVVPVSSVNTNTIDVPYLFACKTSCKTGMQRRLMQIVFTLEANGAVVGRQMLKVKVSSCPKRDKERMEKDLMSTQLKRPMDDPSHGSHPTKKIKLEMITGDEHQSLNQNSLEKLKTFLDQMIGVIKTYKMRIEQLTLP